jgi:hypothetical protein
MYKCPGRHQCKGDTYDYTAVNNDSDAIEAHKKGWYPSLILAQVKPVEFDLKKYLGLTEVEEEVGEEVEEEAEPTRQELLQKAEELGLDVGKKASSKTILNKINKALGV